MASRFDELDPERVRQAAAIANGLDDRAARLAQEAKRDHAQAKALRELWGIPLPPPPDDLTHPSHPRSPVPDTQPNEWPPAQ